MKSGTIIIILIILSGTSLSIYSHWQEFNVQHPFWAPENHCGALCHDEGKFTCINEECYRYICQCMNGTNITTYHTRI